MRRFPCSQSVARESVLRASGLCSKRKATSLLEVIAGLTLMTLLMIPMVGVMSASTRIWRQFESGHDAVAVRQSAIATLAARLRNAVDVISVSSRSIRVRSSSGEIQQFSQSGSQLIYQHGSVREVLAEGIGTLEFQSVPTGLSPQAGQLIRVRLSNPRSNLRGNSAAPRSAVPGPFNSASMVAVWVRPAI